MSTDTRTTPHNLDAEASVLGALLIDGTRLADSVLDQLDTDDFWHPTNQAIYRAITELYQASKPIDAVTVAGELQHQEQLSRIGGITTLTQLMDQVPTTANTSHYAQLLTEEATRRRLLRAGSHLSGLALTRHREVTDLVDEAEQHVLAITDGHETTTPQRLAHHLPAALDGFEHGHQTGTPTGYTDLDRQLNGLKPGNLIVLAARPSMGKTSLALGIAQRTANAGHPVAFISLEMTALELAQRLTCMTARIDSQQAAHANPDADTWTRIHDAANRLSQLPLYIEEPTGLNLATLRSRARRIKREAGGLGLIVVDYLQLMHSDGENRQHEVARISRGLKELARDLDAPVLALSQLNRSVETRDNKRPRLADLRESGSVEQDADVVLFLYRDEYYNAHDPSIRGVAEIDVAKHRNGPTGQVHLTFQPTWAGFESAGPSQVTL